MSHELEFVDGQASYAGRNPGWHQLGTVIDDLSYAEALDKANLGGWNVRAEPLVVKTGEQRNGDFTVKPTLEEIEDQQVVLRDNPADDSPQALSIVGGRYTPIQNEQAFAIAPYLEDLGADVETAGSIREGTQVFMSLTLPQHIVLDPQGANDHVNGYLLLSTSHDGSLAVQAMTTWVRVVCANTLDFALPNADRAYKVRHTQNASDRLAAAQEVILQANAYGERLAQEAQALYKTKMDAAGFMEVVRELHPKPDTDHKPSIARWENKVDHFGDLFSGGGEAEYTLGNVSGTAWAGLNALTEHIDWHRNTRGDDGTALAEAAAGFNPNTQRQKNRIRKTVVSWAQEQNPAAFA